MKTKTGIGTNSQAASHTTGGTQAQGRSREEGVYNVHLNMKHLHSGNILLFLKLCVVFHESAVLITNIFFFIY